MTDFKLKTQALCKCCTFGHPGRSTQVLVEGNSICKAVEYSREAEAKRSRSGTAIIEELSVEPMSREGGFSSLDGVEDTGAEVSLVSDKAIGCPCGVRGLDYSEQDYSSRS